MVNGIWRASVLAAVGDGYRATDQASEDATRRDATRPDRIREAQKRTGRHGFGVERLAAGPPVRALVRNHRPSRFEVRASKTSSRPARPASPNPRRAATRLSRPSYDRLSVRLHAILPVHQRFSAPVSSIATPSPPTPPLSDGRHATLSKSSLVGDPRSRSGALAGSVPPLLRPARRWHYLMSKPSQISCRAQAPARGNCWIFLPSLPTVSPLRPYHPRRSLVTCPLHPSSSILLVHLSREETSAQVRHPTLLIPDLPICPARICHLTPTNIFISHMSSPNHPHKAVSFFSMYQPPLTIMYRLGV